MTNFRDDELCWNHNSYDKARKLYETVVTGEGYSASFGAHQMPEVQRVIFSGPATIVLWSDKTKTIVKCSENDEFDYEKGLAMAICKKAFGDRKFKKVFREYIPENPDEEIAIKTSVTLQDAITNMANAIFRAF